MRSFEALLHAAGELTSPEREHIVTELIAGDPELQRWDLVAIGLSSYQSAVRIAREKATCEREGTEWRSMWRIAGQLVELEDGSDSR